MTDFPVTIFHNPACGTSRNALAMIEAAGYRPEVVDYLAVGWDEAGLRALFAEAGLTPREALREKEAATLTPELLEPGAADEAILKAMVARPVPVQRPIVKTPKGAAMCRPSEAVFDLLERRPETFVKEDGEIIRG